MNINVFQMNNMTTLKGARARPFLHVVMDRMTFYISEYDAARRIQHLFFGVPTKNV